MTCIEEYKEHIEYTFHAFCKVVIRNAKYNALRTWRRKYQREISLEYLTEEKFYLFSTADNYFSGEYPFTICGDMVNLYDRLLFLHPFLAFPFSDSIRKQRGKF